MDLYRVIGERIRSTREKLGLSQLDLAQKIGYSSPSTISHFESGDRKIGIADLQNVARELGMSIDYFLQNTPKKNDLQYFRLRASKVSPTARETVAEFLSFASKQGKVPLGIPPSLEKYKPWNAANTLLEIAKIKQPAVSPYEVANSIGVPVFDWGFPDNISGIFVSDSGKFCIGVNESHPRVRQRFSVAHELGHFVFDRDRGLMLDFVGSESVQASDDQESLAVEINANRFAADLLMPRDWLIRDVKQYGQDVRFLSKRYEVSEQALWFRLLSLKLASEDNQSY
jgi:Zn-dependent peptidase ImmA (M78 family)/DNA-binding XRE family transcriptional regulator